MKKLVLGMVLAGCILLSACGIVGSNTMPTVGNAKAKTETKQEATGPQAERNSKTTQTTAATQAAASTSMPAVEGKSKALKQDFDGEIKTTCTMNQVAGEFVITDSYVQFTPEDNGAQTVIPLSQVLFIYQSETGVSFETETSVTQFHLSGDVVEQMRQYFYMMRTETSRGHR